MALPNTFSRYGDIDMSFLDAIDVGVESVEFGIDDGGGTDDHGGGDG